MHICASNHEEVVSDAGNTCVVCVMRAHYEEQLKELQGYVEVLEADLKGLS